MQCGKCEHWEVHKYTGWENDADSGQIMIGRCEVLSGRVNVNVDSSGTDKYYKCGIKRKLWKFGRSK